MEKENLDEKLEKIRKETIEEIEKGTALPEEEFKKKKEEIFEEPGVEKGEDYDKAEKEFPKEED